MRRKLVFVILLFVLLPFLICLTSTSVVSQPNVGSSVLQIDTDAEYANGTIFGDVLDIWYVWINVSKTQIIYYTLVSDEVNPPVKNFLGQHLQMENGTEVFVGNVLALIEVYNDTNEDGIPQANFTSGQSEIIYYLEVNSSLSYEITSIQKTMVDEIPHYKWGFRYNGIDGFLQHADTTGTGAEVMIDHLGFSYDFYVLQNTSYIKKSIAIGNITNIEPWWEEPPISLDNLSLSILFGTVTSSAEPYTAYVNGEPYDSTQTADSATATTESQIAIQMIKAYEFLFGENYNLTRGEDIETHETKSEAAATTSVPKAAESRLAWTFNHFEKELNLSKLFPSATDIGGEVNLDCNSSTFLYRICYPVWDGLPIEHDPTYVAYLFSSTIIPEIPSILILPLFMMSTLLAVIVYTRKFHR